MVFAFADFGRVDAKGVWGTRARSAWLGNMSGMSGGSMLRARRKDVNFKPNRKLDRKSSRGMLYENEELRLRTININAEVEKGQTDIKKLKRENEQLRREISALRYEYERLDTMLRERSSSPQHSDDSGRSVCSACRECADAEDPAQAHSEHSARHPPPSPSSGSGGVREQPPGGLHVAFHDLSVVPEEEAGTDTAHKSPSESFECTCENCQKYELPLPPPNQSSVNPAQHSSVIPNRLTHANEDPSSMDRQVDVILHDAPSTSYVVTSVASPPPPGFHLPSPPPPGFAISTYKPQPRFHTGGNIEDLLGEVEMGPDVLSTEIFQQNSVFMCNTRKITHRREPCRCQKDEPCTSNAQNSKEAPKCYVTEKNIELTYDYPRTTAIPQRSPSPKPLQGVTTTEVASTVVFVERRFPVRPRGRFDFLFRSQSAPVGENEEPIYATVNKLPKRLRRMELRNLENEVAYRNGDTPRTSHLERTDEIEETSLPIDDDLSRSETEKPPPTQRPDTPKAKKRRRFSFTFKKRGERKKKVEKEKTSNGVQPAPVESDNERLLEGVEQVANTGIVGRQPTRRCRHVRPRTIASSVSSGPRYKRDSYQEMTSHSEHERTNSISSSINSNCSLATHKSRKLSAPPPDTSIPWCGCWGAGCL